jgi:hypothetical protein
MQGFSYGTIMLSNLSLRLSLRRRRRGTGCAGERSWVDGDPEGTSIVGMAVLTSRALGMLELPFQQFVSFQSDRMFLAVANA